MKQSQSQPPILNNKNHKLLNAHQQPQSNSIQNKSRNNSLKKITFNQVGSSHNVQSQSLNSLFPKIQQKVKQRHNIHNQLTVQSSLQRYNSGKWHLPNSLMKKRQRLLTQGNNIIHQNTLIANDSFVSLNNSHSNKKITLPITKQNESIKNTMVEFRKKIEQNRIYIKKEIEKKNKENNNDSRVKRDASLLLVDNHTKAMKKRKQRVASSRFVVVMEDSSEGVGENNALANKNSSNKARSKRTIQTPSNNNGNKLQRSFAKRKSESNKNKKHSNFNSYNANNNKEKAIINNNNAYDSNNSNGNKRNNVQNKNNNKTHRNKQKTQPQASSSMSIKNQKNNNISPHKDQKQHSISKRKSEGLFGQLQVILDEKIRQDVSKERILEEETRLRDLLLKLNTKHKQHDINHNNNNHRAKYHSYHELGPDSNNNKAISIEYASSHQLTNDPIKHHTSLQSSSQQPLTLLQSSDTLPLAQSGTKLTQQLNHQQWHKLQLQSTSQISYTKSSFENELNKISQYADRNDASLEKYLSMRKELMKLGFQVQFGFNQNSKNQKNRKKNQQKSTNDMQKDKENNNT